MPAAITTTLRCRGWRGAAGLRYLLLWRLHCAAVGGAGLQGYIACGYGDYTALLRAWRRAAGLHCLRLRRLRCAALGGAGLQGFIACGYDDYTVLLVAAQGCRATASSAAVAITLCCCERRRAARQCLWPRRLHCAAVDGAGLQGYIACSCGVFTVLLRVAQGCKATLPAAIPTTLRSCGRRKAAGLHCLRLWRLRCAAVGGAGLQGFTACGYGDYTALLWAAQAWAAELHCLRLRRIHCAASSGAGLQSFIACGYGVKTLNCCGRCRAAGQLQGSACGSGEYNAFLVAAQDRRAALPAVVANSQLLRAAKGCRASWPAAIATIVEQRSTRSTSAAS